MRPLLSLPLVLTVLTGCADLDPAPGDLDGIIHWVWTNYEAAGDDDVELAVRNLHATTNAQSLDEAKSGGFSDITMEELAVVGMQDKVDPSATRGMWLLNVIHCPIDQLEKITYALEQNELYTGVYDRYMRTYTSDFEAYTARTTPTLSWDVDIWATILGNSYYEKLHGGLRRVTPEGRESPILLARTWMPQPADFEDDSKSFSQDYQIEVYYERAPGEVVHVYGIWRHMDLGTFLGLDTENDEVIATTLGNLEDWDEKTAELCAQGRP
jgi:hypothetical protein